MSRGRHLVSLPNRAYRHLGGSGGDIAWGKLFRYLVSAGSLWGLAKGLLKASPFLGGLGLLIFYCNIFDCDPPGGPDSGGAVMMVELEIINEIKTELTELRQPKPQIKPSQKAKLKKQPKRSTPELKKTVSRQPQAKKTKRQKPKTAVARRTAPSSQAEKVPDKGIRKKPRKSRRTATRGTTRAKPKPMRTQPENQAPAPKPENKSVVIPVQTWVKLTGSCDQGLNRDYKARRFYAIYQHRFQEVGDEVPINRGHVSVKVLYQGPNAILITEYFVNASKGENWNECTLFDHFIGNR